MLARLVMETEPLEEIPPLIQQRQGLLAAEVGRILLLALAVPRYTAVVALEVMAITTDHQVVAAAVLVDTLVLVVLEVDSMVVVPVALAAAGVVAAAHPPAMLEKGVEVLMSLGEAQAALAVARELGAVAAVVVKLVVVVLEAVRGAFMEVVTVATAVVRSMVPPMGQSVPRA
jgi:hypothetical protein